MTRLRREDLVFGPGLRRYPGRYEVVDAELARGEERIPVVVKKTPMTLPQRLFGTKASRAFRTATLLMERRLPTPEPLGVLEDADASWYVCRRLEGAAQVREWFFRRTDPSRPEPSLPFAFEQIVASLGQLARAMHDSGVFFRDLTDGNVLVTGEVKPCLWLVDLSRARVSDRPLGNWARLRDLARPGLNHANDRGLLLSSYFRGAKPPATFPRALSALRSSIRLRDAAKRFLRPWRR